jgi:HD-GYP domain-containing protein (c-di-GMP phosphodiesterase class II)
VIKTIRTKDLKLGMYVIIPSSWFTHPFLTNSFNITSASQVREIIESGFYEVKIDTAKGMPVKDFERVSHGGGVAPLKNWEPENLIPSELKEAIKDRRLTPDKRASVVYHSSVEMMGKLFKDPKTENIRAAKQAISEIVDMILTNDEVSRNLFQITAHDFYTYTHSVNVGILGVLLSKQMFRHSSAHDMHEMGAGYFMHDLGKVRIDAAIINKPGRLTVEEMKKVRVHPSHSYAMLKEASELSEECRVITLQHHERDDGTGYPRKLKGGEIHVYARVCCIADVYDTLTADRSYKAKLSPFEALKVMKEELLHHFHKDIFEDFVKMFSAAKS